MVTLVIGDPDTVRDHHTLTLRIKGVNRHPYCRGLSLKRISTLGTFRNLRGVMGGVDTVNINLVSTLRSKGVHRHPYYSGLNVKM